VDGLFLAIGLGVILIICGIVVWPLVSIARSVTRALRRRPHFGIGTMFAILAIFAVSFALLKIVAVGSWIVDGLLGMCAFIWSIGIVCGAQLLLEEIKPSRHNYPATSTEVDQAKRARESPFGESAESLSESSDDSAQTASAQRRFD